jgi:hypothetical protein
MLIFGIGKFLWGKEQGKARIRIQHPGHQASLLQRCIQDVARSWQCVVRMVPGGEAEINKAAEAALFMGSMVHGFCIGSVV